MNKLYLSFAAMFYLQTFFALSPLEQAKVDTVAKVYQTNDLERYSIKEFADLQMKATDIHNKKPIMINIRNLGKFSVRTRIKPSYNT